MLLKLGGLRSGWCLLRLWRFVEGCDLGLAIRHHLHVNAMCMWADIRVM